MDDLNRYSLITEKFPREFLLLQGTGCKWKKCTFCDYHTDISKFPFDINKKVLNKVTGQFGVLDIINSGSCTELDTDTLSLIHDTSLAKNIHTLWFEAHWMYKYELKDFSKQFPGAKVKFRTGIETFDANMRNTWKKGIPSSVTARDVSEYFNGICLLIGVDGQTKNSVSKDISCALEHFEYFSINAFVENSTNLKRDHALIKWFIDEWYDKLKNNPKVEILINNTDLGVG